MANSNWPVHTASKLGWAITISPTRDQRNALTSEASSGYPCQQVNEWYKFMAMSANTHPPVLIIHDLAQAVAALAAAEATSTAIQLESAPGAAGYAGAGWFAAVIEAARATHPQARVLAVLDCGAEPGLALGAIREGVEAIRTQARPAVRAKIKAIGQAAKVEVLEGKPGPALDLGTIVPGPRGPKEIEAAARDYLAKRRPR
jgi:hypothetical protein